LAVLALMHAAGFPPRASAGRPANSQNASTKTVTVVIRGFKFDPETVTVNQGDTVEWKNEDIVPHTATEDVAKPAFDSGTIQVGAMWRYVARNKGTHNYTCTLHPNMEGKLIVQ
jgi:plastocyanin